MLATGVEALDADRHDGAEKAYEIDLINKNYVSYTLCRVGIILAARECCRTALLRIFKDFTKLI